MLTVFFLKNYVRGCVHTLLTLHVYATEPKFTKLFSLNVEKNRSS